MDPAAVRLTHLTPRQYKTMPWKNGGGMTTEILAEPNKDGGHLWRLSIAEVSQSGPFSDFSGYDRTIMLIEGSGFTLDFDPKDSDGAPAKRIDGSYEPFLFDGGWKTNCTLIEGPIRDFNLMAAREAGPAEMTIARLDGGGVSIAAAKTVVFHAFDADAAVSGHPLPAGDTLRVDEPVLPLSLDAKSRATVAIIRIGA
jgi:environmental stress-induced protein Ves